MTSKGLITTNFKYMKKLIEKIKSKFSRKPLLVIPAVSGSTPHPEEILTSEHTPKAFQIVQKYKFLFMNQVFGVLFFQRVQVPYERIETPNR